MNKSKLTEDSGGCLLFRSSHCTKRCLNHRSRSILLKDPFYGRRISSKTIFGINISWFLTCQPRTLGSAVQRKPFEYVWHIPENCSVENLPISGHRGKNRRYLLIQNLTLIYYRLSCPWLAVTKLQNASLIGHICSNLIQFPISLSRWIGSCFARQWVCLLPTQCDWIDWCTYWTLERECSSLKWYSVIQKWNHA